MKYGEGYFTSKDHIEFEGEFMNDYFILKHGVFDLINGSHYEGECLLELITAKNEEEWEDENNPKTKTGKYKENKAEQDDDEWKEEKANDEEEDDDDNEWEEEDETDAKNQNIQKTATSLRIKKLEKNLIYKSTWRFYKPHGNGTLTDKHGTTLILNDVAVF